MKLFHAQILAEEQLYLHGLHDWKFKFDNAKKRFGCCNYNNKTISLSKELTVLNAEENVQNTILHEIAHAIAGHQAGHGKKWKEIMMKMGADFSRCYSEEIITPKLKYTAQCPQCKTEIQRKIKRDIACKSCCKKFNGNRFSKNFLFHFRENKK